MIVIVDTDCANLASVRFALERLGAAVTITADPVALRAAEKVLWPGVGSAPAAMAALKARGLDTVLPTLTQPVLGICLGMQLMGTRSDEGDQACLGLLPAPVEALQPAEGLTVPHMGWNRVAWQRQTPLAEGLADGSHFYFVHSFAFAETPFTLATTTHGTTFSAVVQHQNFYGVQFHPERSGPAGARLLRNFLSL